MARGIEVDQWVEEIGAGLNFKRRKFLEIVDDIVAGRVERLVIAHKDRLTRFGFDLVATSLRRKVQRSLCSTRSRSVRSKRWFKT